LSFEKTSSTHTTNKTGERTPPCRTPDVTFINVYIAAPHLSLIKDFEYQQLNNKIMLTGTFQFINFVNSLW